MSDASYQPCRTESCAFEARAVQNVGNTERWISVLGGGALALYGLDRNSLLFTGLGAALLYRGLSGRCQLYGALGMSSHSSPQAAMPAQAGARFEQRLVIQRPARELYDFWRQLDNLPRIMRHLHTVEQVDHSRSRWTAIGPLGIHVDWEAEIINDEPGRLIAWRSLPGGHVQTAGSVHFDDREQGGTELTVSLKYNPPGGKIGAAIAWLLGEGVEQEIGEDLQRFREKMESRTGSPTGPV